VRFVGDKELSGRTVPVEKFAMSEMADEVEPDVDVVMMD
jgi:hypothetical protein